MKLRMVCAVGTMATVISMSGAAQGPGAGAPQGSQPAQGQQGQRGARPDWHQPPPLPLEQGASQQEVTRAVAAAPANQQREATVIKWKPDFTYDTLRTGTNKLVCYELSGWPTHPPFLAECTSPGNLPRVAQNLKLEAMGDQRQAAMDAAEKDGTRVKPEFGSLWYHSMGPAHWTARAHVTIAVPGATTRTLGLPENGNVGGAWIMNAGTTTAHIMIPGEPGSGIAQVQAANPPLPLEPGAVQAEVNRVLLAAPANLAAGATVIQWKPDFTYATLRKGTNKLVCYDLADRPTHQPFAGECTALANLPRAAQNLKIEAMGEQRQAAFDAAEKDGSRVKPEYGSTWYHLMGAHRWDARPHLTIAVPGATARSTGLPESGSQGGVWIMNAGTTTAHLMIPGY